MKRFAPLLACCVPLVVTSCNATRGIMQPTQRFIQSGMRTLSDAGESTTPATRAMRETFGVALSATGPANPDGHADN